MNKTKFFSSLLVAALFASTSVFTSCKDYDDDIKNLQSQIDGKSLKADLESLKTSLETRLATLESTLNTKEAALKAEIEKKADKTALDAKANQSDLTALAARVKAVEDLTAEIAGIKEKIASIEETLAKKADQEALKNLENAVATLTGKVNERLTEAQVKEIVDASAALQTKALNDFKTEINEKLESLGLSKADLEKLTDVNGKIAAIEDALKAFTGAETVDEAKKKMQALAEEIDKNVAAIDVLEAFVKKQLTSMVLMPSFYWEGLEGIEVPFGTSPIFKEKKEDYAFTYTVKKAMGDEQVKVTVKSTMGFDATVYDKDKKNVGTYFLYAEKIASFPSFWDHANHGTAGPANLKGKDAETLLANKELIPRNKLREKNGVATDTAIINYAKLMQGGVAKYHYNPSTADLTGFTVSFFENDAEVYTRGNNGAVVATPRTEDITAENGILTVPFDVDGAKLMSMFQAWTKSTTWEPQNRDSYDQPVHGGATWTEWGGSAQDNHGSFGRGAKLPFIAAQLTSTGEKGDTTITSDYGVLVPAVLEIVALADNDPIDGSYFVGNHENYATNQQTGAVTNPGEGKIRANHLYESVGYNGIEINPEAANNGYNNYGAITMPATHEILYTEKAFDLKPFIDTHVSYTNYARYGTSTVDRVMTAAEMEALGLHYEFTIVDYIVGNEKTSQSAHIIKVDANGNPTDDAKSGCFSVRSVDEDGKTMVNEKATLETVGREPLIRVDLKDEAGNIVRYGYIKLRVVKDKAEDMAITFNMNDMYMNCGEASKLTWSQVENKLLRQINMTKEDFEKLYHLDVVGGYANMPYITPTADQKTNGVADPSGKLYANAFTNKWMAKRWYNAGTDEAPDFKKVPTIEDDNDLLTNINDDVFNAEKKWKWTTSANWFGRVWYTPHDNSTTTHNWDENTNVLEWNFGEILEPAEGTMEQATNMKRVAYEQMMKVLGVTYESKGLNTKPLSTTVRFVHKNGSAIYVTLTYAVGKIHFPYGDINRRVLDHWYSMTKGYADASGKQYTDTIEVYANVPTPAEVGQANLTTASFTKDLKEYWLSKQIIPEIHNLYKADGETKAFDKFWNYTDNKYDGNVTFQFRLPKEGENADFSADNKGKWKVKGISGNEYTLKLNADKNQIIAEKNEKAGMSADEVICTLDATTGVIHYNGRDQETKKSKGVVEPYTAIQPDVVNGAATDILNYIGMYDATGKNQKEFYVTKQQDKAFTAFVEIKVANVACYDPIIGHNFFNVRFLRPINVWPAEKSITDAPNKTQFINIWELLYIRDWRTYAVVPDANTEQQFGKTAVAGTGFDGKKHKGNFEEGNVPYKFYNISNLYVQRDSIRSDAYLEADKRVVLTKADDIKKLYSIDDIPALTNDGLQYLKIIAKSDATDQYTVAGTTKKTASTSFDDVLAYTNNGGVVKPFHIYVPIAVEYAWGALDIYTQRVWAVITVDPTVGNE